MFNSNVGVTYKVYDRSRTGTTAFLRNLSSTKTALLRFGATVGAIAGIGGVGYMIKRQMEAIDTTAKLSDRLGMTTEALVGLQHGAKISGVEQGTLNKSLEIFSRRLGEVRMGVGQAKYALDSLGLSADELVNKSPSEAIEIVADQISRLKTQSDKASAANYLFGRSGQQLLNLFEQGSAGIKDFRKETVLLGLSFSRIDAAKVEAANDALTRTKEVFTGLFMSATIKLAPYIESAATAFVKFATKGEGVGANVTNAFQSMTLAMVKMGEETERLIIKLNRILSPVETVGKELAAIQDATKRYRIETGEGRRLRPGQPELFEKILKQERAKLGLEAEQRESAVRQWFTKLKEDAQARAEAAVKSKQQKIVLPAPPISDLFKSEEFQKNITEVIEANEKRAFQQLSITAKMYKDMESESQAYRDVQVQLLDYEIEKYQEVGVDAVLIEQWKADQIKKINEGEGRGKVNQTVDVLRAYEQMYSQIGRMDQVAYNARLKLIDEEKKRYLEMGVSEVAIKKLANEQKRQLDIQYARDSQDLFRGAAAAFDEMEHNKLTLGQVGYQAAYSARDAWGSAFESMMVDGQSWSEAMKGFMNDVGLAFKRLAAQMVAEELWDRTVSPVFKGISAGISGAIGGMFSSGPNIETGGTNPNTVSSQGRGWHIGGIVGRSGGNLLGYDSPALWANAPRLQAGTLRSDEFRAVLHRNEHVLRPDQMNMLVGAAAGGIVDSTSRGQDKRINLHVYVHEGQNQEVTREEEYILSDERVKDIVIRLSETNGQFRGSLQQAVRR
jgi:hypothetical protein